MTAGALGFMIMAWGLIIGTCVISLMAILKHSKAEK